jgi:hypothetical protein
MDEGREPILLNLVRVLRRLARANEIFEDSTTRTRTDFELWAPGALEAVSELRTLTRGRLGTV